MSVLFVTRRQMTLHQTHMDNQLSKQHTCLRDGIVIPYTAIFLDEKLDKPGPVHIFSLLQWTWDETYDEPYEKPEEAQ